MVQNTPAGKIDVPLLLTYKTPIYEQYVSSRDAILYGLSINFGTDPMNRDHFRFTYENDENFAVFPCMYHTLSHSSPFRKAGHVAPGLEDYNQMMLMHGEETLEVHRPMMPNTHYLMREEIADL